jgi:hypothetical protein
MTVASAAAAPGPPRVQRVREQGSSSVRHGIRHRSSRDGDKYTPPRCFRVLSDVDRGQPTCPTVDVFRVPRMLTGMARLATFLWCPNRFLKRRPRPSECTKISPSGVGHRLHTPAKRKDSSPVSTRLLLSSHESVRRCTLAPQPSRAARCIPGKQPNRPAGPRHARTSGTIS